MIFDLERYIDEPLVYFDDKRKIDDQKVFLLGMRIRTDMVDLLLNGVKAKDIIVKKLDPTEDPSFGLINMVADSVLSDWGFELTDPSEVGESPETAEEEPVEAKRRYAAKISQTDSGEAKILKKTIANFKMSDSRLREGAVIRALKDDFDVFRDQLNSELNVFPAPMREMIMMTLLDRFHSWEKSNWDTNNWD
ncbi:MAG: hypothetical protein IKG30_06265 [Clostridiales bacterium]|nr:hypothetical protein [Clostridiales bacterium]